MAPCLTDLAGGRPLEFRRWLLARLGRQLLAGVIVDFLLVLATGFPLGLEDGLQLGLVVYCALAGKMVYCWV